MENNDQKLLDATNWINSLISPPKQIPPEKISSFLALYDAFMAETQKTGGCSGCRLRRLRRSYAEKLKAL